MAQVPFTPEADVPSPANKRMLRLVLALVLTFLVSGLAGCGGGSASESGFPNPRPLPVKLTVNPPSATIAAGSATTFTASPSPPPGFSLAWSVNPASGGTITSGGLYTASETAGDFMVVATWIPSTPSAGKGVTGSATVTVLQPVAHNNNLTQASGVIQTAGAIENATIAGERIPSVTSTDPTGNVRVRSGFPIPVPCTGSDSGCQ
jgi:hypothetical protein